jgi:hypothetical protein
MFRSTLLAVLATAPVVFATHADAASAPIPNFVPGQEWSIKSTSPTTAKVISQRHLLNWAF